MEDGVKGCKNTIIKQEQEEEEPYEKLRRCPLHFAQYKKSVNYILWAMF
jgi:hypothetical protein